MHRIDGPGYAPGHLFTEGNPLTAVPPTVVTADWLNDVQENLAQAIEGAGITLVKGSHGQLLAAINALIAAYTFVPADGSITAAKLAATLDMSAKTITLPATSVTAAMLAATLDLSGKTLTLSAAQKANDYIEIRDEKAAGTNGGTFNSGAWQTRTLNTEHSDAGNHATLSSNQITLDAGTYVCHIIAPGYAVNTHKARLRNITDSTTTLVGTAARSATGGPDASTSSITGRFTIASAKTFEVQHRCETSGATTGFGPASAFADEIEIYAVARFWKVG